MGYTRWSVDGGRFSTASGSEWVGSEITRSLPLAVLNRPPATPAKKTIRQSRNHGFTVLCNQLSQDVLQDPPVLVVVDLDRRIDPEGYRDSLRITR